MFINKVCEKSLFNNIRMSMCSSVFKVYTDGMCTFHYQVSDFRFSVHTTGFILLFYMLVILGIMFREFKFRNIMS